VPVERRGAARINDREDSRDFSILLRIILRELRNCERAVDRILSRFSPDAISPLRPS